MILDLTLELMHKEEFVFIPCVSLSTDESPGYINEQLKIIFKDLEDLSRVGMKIVIDGVTHIIKVDLITITGNSPALESFTESVGQRGTHPCTFCKIKKGEFSEGGSKRILFFPDVKYNSMAGMRRIYEENDFVVTHNTWKVKEPFLSYQIDGLDFMRVSVPDIMHVVCANVFPKRIYYIYENGTLRT
ncbi:hypothetical protein C6P40_002339 [Pichia californica]|uniref:Uncharacterized protein n=1 Tax=Pichia californica TaxID=460514 RepID=A0A9P7BI94_9ASCO|nr:hypothetical protein C6P42_004902 [[Candida] californica]KAG0690588.1 hypothetical protein C6P40_002339 [[Candida] californica]